MNSTSKTPSPALFFFLGGIVMLIIMLVLIVVFRKMIKPEELKKLVARACRQPASKDLFSGNLRTISYFDFHTLKMATKNFHPGNLLGVGGFGPVYRGKLGDGRLIAAKKLCLDKSQQGESEFLTEVKLITSVQHRNLVRLIGCCSDGPQRLLVYEYMKNRSLDLIVYGKSDRFLNWSTRFQIIVGIARGLQYLHEDSPLRIIHRDIKASNILLDEKYQPKIGDFGLARFFPEDQAYLSTAFAGTFYRAKDKQIKEKLLALQSFMNSKAWKLFEMSKVIELVDPKLHENGFVERDVLQAIQVAFLCLQPHANLRPPMSEVVAMLTCKVEMIGTPMKPAFLERRRTKDQNLSWDTISEVFPSPFRSESTSLPKPPT
ncbi:putative serine/threonine-protein kinase [Prunus yedoensis var. nudiflora]|uniref:non-specific serine/threonine protein kinase n=1 Tax=Prunus yedoensis var. nudiflora TaxID=2094558 RepID=A0A314Z863_PRUYE|nr:putative serine/threonine-protein kinase [Prunus yedoensis var. nudiflora]